MKKFILIAAAATFFLAQTACEKSLENASASTSDDSHTVGIKNGSFSPANVWIGKGATVTWVNGDATAHTVTEVNNIFNSGDIAPGSNFRYTFDSAAAYQYRCLRHPSETAVVNVVQPEH
jgi:plastocyanin